MDLSNPNGGYPYAEISNISPSGFDVRYSTYYVRFNSLGQTINKWVPSTVASTKIAFTAVGVPNPAAAAGQIIGDSLICSSSVTFTIPNFLPGCSVVWNKSSNLILSSQSGNNATFITNGIGSGWVIATINSGCGPVILQKTVWLGKPIISVSNISNLQDMGYSNYYKMLPASGINPFEGTLMVDVPIEAKVTDYTWSFYANMPKKNIAYWSASGNTLDAWAKTANAGEVLKCSATNTCGSSYVLYTFFTGDIGQPPPPPLIITPNPATTQAEVSMPDNTATTEVQCVATMQNMYTVTVMNSYGLSVYSASGSEKIITVPTSTLTNGIYIVRVSDGTTVYQGNLIVNH